MLKFNSLLRFHDGASAALRAIRGHVFSRPGQLSDYVGWPIKPIDQPTEWIDLPPAADPWLDSSETQILYVDPTQWQRYRQHIGQ